MAAASQRQSTFREKSDAIPQPDSEPFPTCLQILQRVPWFLQLASPARHGRTTVAFHEIGIIHGWEVIRRWRDRQSISKHTTKIRDCQEDTRPIELQKARPFSYQVQPAESPGAEWFIPRLSQLRPVRTRRTRPCHSMNQTEWQMPGEPDNEPRRLVPRPPFPPPPTPCQNRRNC